ncbi:hypothetical protein M9Y10_001799 [Tritrichomonas musculus]|uniref:HNH nuclease domain-containing protein n=1 Tax=Tritrichomonas musculus TaxID=1915356 RepID=A0ABR2H998_9EUKA
MNKESKFVPLKDFENEYEICTEYPFDIRNKDDHIVVEEFKRGMGYITVKLNDGLHDKHKLIALQFIENDDPNHKTQVDHLNKDRIDNHLTNLRWVTPSKNLENRSSANGIMYDFVDELPDNIIKVDYYQSKYSYYEFEDNKYFYDVDNDEFYVFISENIYKKMHICIDKNNLPVVNLRDIDNRKCSMYVSKFKQQHDVI